MIESQAEMDWIIGDSPPNKGLELTHSNSGGF